MKVVVNGAGSAGIAITKLLLSIGVKDVIIGIGIGINNNRVLLQMKKLKEKNPIFDIKIAGQLQSKIMGINAARLEKKIPFKEFVVKED
jgi:malic enzyme